MDSQYPALQLVPIAGITHGMVDRTKPSEEEYIMPVLGTIMVHGVTESKPDPDDLDLSDIVPTGNALENTKPENKTTPVNTPSTESLESRTSHTVNGVTEIPDLSSVQGTIHMNTTDLCGITNSVECDYETAQQTLHEATVATKFPELHGITNSKEVDHDASKQTSVQSNNENLAFNGAMNSPEPKDNLNELNGVTKDPVVHLSDNPDMGNPDISGITNNTMQTHNNELNDTGLNDDGTLPDLVLNNNVTLNEANTTEDEDEAAEALLQLSKSDTLPDEDPELPLGVLPVDAAPVPIALGNQDVLNAIENFKHTSGETGVTLDNSNVNKNPNDPNKENDNNDNNNKEKKNDNDPKSTPELTPPTSPAKGSLVIVKHGIRRKKSTEQTYKCARCDK